MQKLECHWPDEYESPSKLSPPAGQEYGSRLVKVPCCNRDPISGIYDESL